MNLTRSGFALAILMAVTPAAAETRMVSSHEIHFSHITFTCGEIEDQGKMRRFVYATPYKINLQMYEPLPGDQNAAAWLVAYRTICEKAAHRSQLANAR